MSCVINKFGIRVKVRAPNPESRIVILSECQSQENFSKNKTLRSPAVVARFVKASVFHSVNLLRTVD